MGPFSLSRRNLLWIALGLFGVLLLIYGRSLANDFVRWDDGLLIYENPATRTISLLSLKTIFTTFDPELYIPFTLFNYQILYQIFGQHAWGYHLWSLLLHTGNALLLTTLAYRLSRNTWAALITGVLFAVHPIQVEAVAWASALKDQLSTAFYAGALLSYVLWREQGNRRLYILSIVLCLFGLLSKVMVVTLPIALLLIDDLEGRAWWSPKVLLEKIPFLLLSIIFGLVAIFGKQVILESTTPWATFLMAMKSTVFYMEKILWPQGFSILYPYIGPVSLSTPAFFIPALILVAIAIMTIWYRKKIPVLFFGFGFFLLTLIPTFINFSKNGSLFIGSDRYAYLPSFGLFFLVGLGIAALLERSKDGLQKAILVILALVVITLGFLSYTQSMVWSTSEALFRHALQYYPNSYAAHNNLGNIYRRQGKIEEAITEFQAALKIEDHPKVHENLGAVYTKKGMPKEAEAEFQKAIVLDPTSAEPYFGLGILFGSSNQYEKGLAAYDKAIELDPRYASAYVNRGSLLLDMGRSFDAEADFRKAIEIEPYFAQAHFNLAVLLTRQGNTTDAITQYEDTVSMQPFFIQARLNLGSLYAKVGKLTEAKNQFLAVLQINPGNAVATNAISKIEAALQ